MTDSDDTSRQEHIRALDKPATVRDLHTRRLAPHVRDHFRRVDEYLYREVLSFYGPEEEEGE